MGEELIRRMLSHAESFTLGELEEEIMEMLTTLEPYPIVMQRVKGIFVEEHGLSDFAVLDEGEDVAYCWMVRGCECSGIGLTFIVAMYEALDCRTATLLERAASEQMRKIASVQFRHQDEQKQFMARIYSMHKESIKLFDGARVERVIRNRGNRMYMGRIRYVLADFTLHGKTHQAWYTLNDGWHEIPMGVSLDRLKDRSGELCV